MSELDSLSKLICKMKEAQRESGKEYIVNDRNMERFNKVYDFFSDLADENCGEIVYFDIRPESTNAKVTIDVPPLDIYQDWLDKFIDVLQYIDVFEVTPSDTDGILVSASVGRVWEVSE